MRFLLSTIIVLSSTIVANASGPYPVPEIDAIAGIAALGLVGAISALVWERRRK